MNSSKSCYSKISTWQRSLQASILFITIWSIFYIFNAARVIHTDDAKVQGAVKAALCAGDLLESKFSRYNEADQECTNLAGTVSISKIINDSAFSVLRNRITVLPATPLLKTTCNLKSSSELLDDLIHGDRNICPQLVLVRNELLSLGFTHTKGAGEMGRPFSIVGCPEVARRYRENEFNVVVSEHISLKRSLPYTAPSACKQITYPKQLPTCSVIMVFYNAAWSTLLRSIHSILNRSPAHLLKEIILIDDASDREYLKGSLEKYLRNFTPKVLLQRLPKRSGLVGARLEGARRAKGEVLVFLDAHIEVTTGWLEPLLSRVKDNRTIVVSPTIDIIDDKTFALLRSIDLQLGTFTWSLHFRWTYNNSVLLRNRNPTDTVSPYQTPAFAGGLFAIDRRYFWNIGSYDEQMKIWGGENIEMSFRVWMCGGSMEIHPCSHVGHVFRTATPYNHGNRTFNTLSYNNVRVAEVWLDEYKDFFYSMNSVVNSSFAGDVNHRRALRQRLGCKSFRWYLKNIIPEGSIPVSYYSLGTIMNDQTLTCIQNMETEKVHLILNPCSDKNYRQVWSYTSGHQIRNDETCIAFDDKIGLFENNCDSAGDSGKWDYDSHRKWLRHRQSGQCLTASEWLVMMSRCHANLLTQSWTIHGYDGLLKPNHG